MNFNLSSKTHIYHIKPFTTNKLLTELLFHKSLFLKDGEKSLLKKFLKTMHSFAVEIKDNRNPTIQLHIHYQDLCQKVARRFVN